MNKFGIVVAIIFVLIYLVSFFTFLYFSANEEIYSNVGKVCSDYIVDERTNFSETGHYENRREFCYFFHMNITTIIYIIAVSPFMFIILMWCVGFKCSFPILVAVGAILNLIFYAFVGYSCGLLLSKLFSKRKSNNT